ncbi:hypothetical protein UY3_06693, partial [Chelonia mydas]
STPKNQEAKRLDVFGRKIYSMASLQVRVANHQALFGHYDFNIWQSMAKFMDVLPEEPRKELLAILGEGRPVARLALQVASDAADFVAQTMALVILMRQDSLLQLLGLSMEVQQSIQDLPFEGLALFSQQMDSKLPGLKDSRATLRSLGLYMLGLARKRFKLQPPPQLWEPTSVGALLQKGPGL